MSKRVAGSGIPYRGMPSGPTSAHDAFRTTLDLFEAGLALMRQNLRRAHADATDNDIDQRLREWLRLRPGAEEDDSPGRRGDLTRRIE